MVQSLEDTGSATDERSILEKEAIDIDTSEYEDVDEFEDVELEKAAAANSNGTSVDEAGVAAVQKTSRTVRISRKGKKAIAASILTVVVALVAGLLIGFKLRDSGSNNPLELFLGEICSTTLYPETCNSTLYGADTRSTNSYVAKSMKVSITATNETLLNLTRCRDAWPIKTGMQYSTLQMCLEMYEDIVDASGKFLDTVNSKDQVSVAMVNDLEQRASAALTYHFTCLKGLQEYGLLLNGSSCGGIDMERTTELLSNALSLVNMFPAAADTAIPTAPSRRRLLTDSAPGSYAAMEEGLFPTWLGMGDRRLLQSSSNDSLLGANVVVALDGSGDYRSIQTAIDRAPSNSDQRYVIHIKAGVYEELVKVPGSKTRLTFVGDGAGVTIISGNLSSGVNNVTTVFTATVTVSGDYFIAKNLTIRNTAGPNGHQAVALRVTSQQSAFTWLNIEGYENTLYAHASQQFYKSCTVFGTVNYIFGSAAAVFQNSSLLARLPSPDQTIITYTASDINSALVQKYAGLVFMFCLVDATPELTQNGTGHTSVYLGRPGEAYARTVFIKSQLGALLDPAGWIPWNKSSASNSSESNVELAEYLNFGQGSGLSLRVVNSKQLAPWQAVDYGVDKFLKGKLWLPAMNISYSGSI